MPTVTQRPASHLEQQESERLLSPLCWPTGWRVNPGWWQPACFVAHSCSHTWAKQRCVNEEVSASLWGILSTGQQVHDSLTCSLHQLRLPACVRVCARECVCPAVLCVRVRACGDQMATRALGKPGACWTLPNRAAPAAASAAGGLQGKLWKAVCCAAGYWRRSGRDLALILSLQWKKKKERKTERRGPSGLTAPFILYYPAWLLTPGELCSQIDALLLWGCSRNIKLYWNIHMWVHLAESNWCATPQTLNGNVAGPRHELADTLSCGRWDAAKTSESDPGAGPPVSARRIVWVGAVSGKHLTVLLKNLRGDK